MLNYHDGHQSLGTAARALASSYRTVARLAARGDLRAGRYPGKRRGRFVVAASVREFAKRRALAAVHDLTPKEST